MVSPPELPLAVVKLGQRWWVPGVSVSKLSSASSPRPIAAPDTETQAQCFRLAVWQGLVASQETTSLHSPSLQCPDRRGTLPRMESGGSGPVPVVATPRFTPPAASRRLPEHATTATTRALP